MKKTIYFSDRDDPRVGFLSNESKHSFLLEDRLWPTVEHYLQAKKFEGTPWEEHIRQAPTVFLAKFYTIPRKITSRTLKGDVITEDYYGDGKKRYCIRVGWTDSLQKELLKKAIIAKFEQNKNLQDKLLETRNMKLVDITNPFTGGVIEEYRTALHKKKLKIQTDEEKFSGLMKDISRKDLYEGKEISSLFIENIHIISTHFSVKNITKEMIEDMILIATPPSSLIFCMEYIHRFAKVTASDIYQKLPNVNKLITHIEDTLQTYYQKDFNKIVPVIYSYLKWVLLESGQDRNSIFEKIKSFHQNPTAVSLPNRKREYRKDNSMKKIIVF